MKHYYKAKEIVKKSQEEYEESYEIGKHVINTAYYALKHNIKEEELDSYIDSVIDKTHKKLISCGCQCYIFTPLGTKIGEFEGGGWYVDRAKSLFKKCVKKYYEDLYLYNSEDNESN